jgi:hypothetical protein
MPVLQKEREMSNEVVYADAFGGKFPVCSEQDKVAIEEGFKKAMEWSQTPEAKEYDNRPAECACTLIARLLKGEATYGDMVQLGIDMANSMYVRKAAAVAVMSMLADRTSEVPNLPPPFPGGSTKKEWLN